MIAFSTASTATALAAGLLLLAACAAEPSGPAATGQRGTALPPPSAGESAAGGSLPVAPSAPLPPPISGETQAAPGEPVIVEGPDGTTWEATSAKNAEVYQDDIENCYRYATAQTRRDAQFIDDRNAGIDTLTNQSPYSGLRQRVDEYDLRNRRASLMSSCMESKGYARADTVLPRLEF